MLVISTIHLSLFLPISFSSPYASPSIAGLLFPTPHTVTVVLSKSRIKRTLFRPRSRDKVMYASCCPPCMKCV
ncbi:uncharacterized protein EI90DRAFT_3067619, partial [Cantharellus anzutake]|uniref:uncharacterized protein n=1 Tax=Cantharellus anzutake TaxID=1750568 RepID=UPI001905C924